MSDYRAMLQDLRKMAAAIGLNTNSERFGSYSQHADLLLQKLESEEPGRKLVHDIEELFVDFSNSINEYVKEHHQSLSGKLFTRAILTKGRVMSELFIEEHTTIREQAQKSAVFRAYLEEAGEPVLTEDYISGRREISEDPELAIKFRIYIAILNGISRVHMDPSVRDETEKAVAASIHKMGIIVPEAEEIIRKREQMMQESGKSAAVRYFTLSGNTRSIAEAIAKELGIPALSLEYPLERRVDELFLCNSMYWGGIDRHVRAFISDNAGQIGEIVNVSTSALGRSTLLSVRDAAERAGVRVSDANFYCRGSFHMLQKGRPSETDFKQAAAFARQVME